MCDTGILVLLTTLRDPPDWFCVRAYCDNMAILYKCHWTIQHLLLESPCIQSTLSLLHVQVLEKDPKRWLDVLGWDSFVYNRFILSYVFFFLVVSKVLPIPQFWRYLYTILNKISGSEAMFADLGHFSQLSIKVNQLNY